MAKREILECGPVSSLTWVGEELVDWVRGGKRYRMDGRVTDPRVYYAYRFDAACGMGSYAVIYERLGTKGVILKDGDILREIHRSFYHANAYEYPVCMWADAQGHILMAHCPDQYNRIEIDDVLTGERLTAASDRVPDDFFHSRLQANSDGTRLLSAGWLWHPWDAVSIFDISQALQNPKRLDAAQGCNLRYVGGVPESSACWQSADRILIAGGEEDCEPDDEEWPDAHLCRNSITVYDIAATTTIRSIHLDRPVGTMMAAGENAVVVFYQHPRLISLEDGSVIDEWPGLPTGQQTSSIIRGLPSPLPPIALDTANRRFAVAVGEEIHVISL
jgi:hypothetical protein